MPRERRHLGRYPHVPSVGDQDNRTIREHFNKTGQLPASFEKYKDQVEWLCLVCDSFSKHKSSCREEVRNRAILDQQLSRVSNMDGLRPTVEENYLNNDEQQQEEDMHDISQQVERNVEIQSPVPMDDVDSSHTLQDTEPVDINRSEASLGNQHGLQGDSFVQHEDGSRNMAPTLDDDVEDMLQLEDNETVASVSRRNVFKSSNFADQSDSTGSIFVDETLFPSLQAVWNALKTTLPVMSGLKRKSMVTTAIFQQLWPDYCRRLPDPLRVENPTSEHFFCEGSELGVVDVGMFWPQLFDAELIKCPWCAFASSEEAPITRAGFRAGFMIVRTLEGRLKFLKVAQYKHVNCPNALSQAKKGLLFGALHPALFMQYHALVQRKLGSLVLKRPFVPSECVELLGGSSQVVKRAFKNLDRLHRQIFATEMAVRERMQEQYNEEEHLANAEKHEKESTGTHKESLGQSSLPRPTFFSDSDESFVGLLTEVIGRPTAITRSMGVSSLTHPIYTPEEKFLFRSMLLSTTYVKASRVAEYSTYLSEGEEKLCVALSKSKTSSKGGPSRPLDWINFDSMAIVWAKLWQKAEVTANCIPATVNGEEKQLDHSRVFLKSSDDLKNYTLKYAKSVVSTLRTSPGSMTLSAAVAVAQAQQGESGQKRGASEVSADGNIESFSGANSKKKKLMAPPCPVCGEAMRRGGKHAVNCQFKFYQANYHNKDVQFGYSRASSKQSMVAAALHAWHSLEDRDREEIERHMLEALSTQVKQNAEVMKPGTRQQQQDQVHNTGTTTNNETDESMHTSHDTMEAAQVEPKRTSENLGEPETGLQEVEM